MTIDSTGANRTQRALNSQFQGWFSPTAQRARYVRVRRLATMLHAFINFVGAEQGQPWPFGKPMGLASPLSPLSTFRERTLAAAYMTLGINISFANEDNRANLPRLTLGEAQSIIVGNYRALITAPPEPELGPDDDDNLSYAGGYGETQHMV
jgi:hypothetical protein